MKRVSPAAILALTVICLGALLARGQAQPQLVPDLHKYKIQVDYYAPRDPAFQSLYQKLQQRKVLEELGQFLAPVSWPKTLRLIMKQCPRSGTPTPAVFYDYDEYSLTVCYQLFADLQLAAATTQPGGSNASFATPQEAIVGGLIGVVLHESARATFDMLQVPVLGSDEDAADQLAGLIGLQFGPQVARAVIKGTYLLWNTYDHSMRARNLPYNFASRSSVAPQRADNILCIAYGGQSAIFKDFVDQGLLPASRAGHCAAEYRQAADAFLATIQPHVNMTMMNQVLTTATWITPEDLK
jgi:hypothetical protein